MQDSLQLYDVVEEQIKHNNLEGLEYNFLVRQLCVLNNAGTDAIKDVINQKIGVGRLKIADGKVYFCTKDERAQNIDIDGKKREIKDKLNNTTSDRQANIDLALEMLEKKDKKRKSGERVVIGKLQGTTKGYAFLLPDDINEPDIFIPPNEFNGAMHRDRVAVAVKSGSGRPEGRVVKIIERGNINIVGTIKHYKKESVVTPKDVKFGRDIIIPRGKAMDAKNGQVVVCNIEKYFAGLKYPEGRVVEVLGEEGEIDTEVLSIVREYNLYENFPNKVKEIAENLPQSVDKNNYKNRLDFTNKLIFTIDGEDTRDIDDAISLEVNEKGNRVLGVHIADVGEYVKVGSVIDHEAFNRGTSVYFPNSVLPMLPRELSNGICSLNERVDRLALSVLMEMDENANILSYKIGESIINSKRRYTYTEVHKVLMGDKDAVARNSQFVDTLVEMNKLAEQLGKLRKNRGEILFNIPEVDVSVDSLGRVVELKKREVNESHKMIESFMISANETIAHEFLKNKIPFVYRVHEVPDGEKIDRFTHVLDSAGIQYKINKENITSADIQKILEKTVGNPNEYAINRICLRSMKKAKYSPDCLGHFGLASKEYCHFTSPIRRYPDLTIHRIIKDCLHNAMNGKNMAFYKNFVVESSMRSSEREKLAEDCERDVDDLYRAYYMRDHIAEEFEGTVSGVTAFGVFVELDNTVEGLVSIADLPYDHYDYNEDEFALVGGKNTYKLGQRVKVKVLNVSIPERKVDFMLI